MDREAKHRAAAIGLYEHISRNAFRHRDSVTGVELTWAQEDEADITAREEAVAVIQRTIDFWLVKLRDDLLLRGLPRVEAEATAIMAFEAVMGRKLLDPFPSRFKLTLADLKFSYRSAHGAH